MVSFVESSPLITKENGTAARPLATSSGEPLTVSAQRHCAILRMLSESGRISVDEIATRFDISSATARRDMNALTVAGRARRRRGELVPAGSFGAEQHYRARALIQVGAKSAIARRVAQHLPHEGTIFVDAGTTCFEVGRLLAERPGLHLMTNSLPLLALAPQARARLSTIGGEARRLSLAVTAGFTQSWLDGLRFDAAVVGAAGVDPMLGAYTSELHEAAVKSAALCRARVRLLVADAEKWNRPNVVHFAPWSAFSFFATNQTPAEAARARLTAAGVRLLVTAA